MKCFIFGDFIPKHFLNFKIRLDWNTKLNEKKGGKYAF